MYGLKKNKNQDKGIR